MNNEKIQQMHFLEQNLQSILMQRQAFQMELNESIAALKEIEDSKDDVYKIIGQLMIKVSKDKIKEELTKKEKLIGKRLEALEKQEKELSSQATQLREEILGSVKRKKK